MTLSEIGLNSNLVCLAREKQVGAAVFYYAEAATIMQKLFNLNSNQTYLQYVHKYNNRAGGNQS